MLLAWLHSRIGLPGGLCILVGSLCELSGQVWGCWLFSMVYMGPLAGFCTHFYLGRFAGCVP